MGTWSEFDCKKCGYTVNVSGGKDFGMVAVVQTMICNDCKELVDVLIGRCGETGKSGDIEYDKDLDVCPECRGTNLSTWSASTRSCPRCRQKLNKGQVVAMWD